MFVDLADHYGITQILVNEESRIEMFRKIPEESTVCVTGKVLERDEENYNPNIETGKIEVLAEDIIVDSEVKFAKGTQITKANIEELKGIL